MTTPAGPPARADWLIRDALVVTMDDDAHIYPSGFVTIRDHRVAAVGDMSSLPAGLIAVHTLDGHGMAVLPGLVNTHTHLAMTLFRGLVDDVPLQPWLDTIWPLEGRYATYDNVRAGATLAIAEMISGGTTTAADMYWQRDATAEAAEQAGFRLVTGPSFIDFVGPDGIQPEDREPLAREFLTRYKSHPLITACVQAHATYSVPLALLEMTRAIAEEFQVLFVTHASENASEVDIVTERYGKTPIELLDSLGLLGPRSLLAHCVVLRPDEIAMMAERRAAVAHCPESNLKMGSGVAPVKDLLQAGVTVGLGTDGAATNNDLDMWGEMHTAALLQKGTLLDPTVLPANQALRMATIDGARALGLGGEIGSLEPGKWADLVLIDLDQPHLTPRFDIYSLLVYAARASDVDSVFIHGRPVLQDRRLLTLDREAVERQVAEVAAQFDQGGPALRPQM